MQLHVGRCRWQAILCRARAALMIGAPAPACLPRRYVVQEIIKEMAKSRPVGIDGQRGFKVGAGRMRT